MSMKALLTLSSLPANAGKLWRIVRAARAAMLAAFPIGLVLAGSTAAAQDPCLINIPPTSGGLIRLNESGHEKERVWLRILAFTDAPVAGADVRVSEPDSEGRPLDFEAATNDQGAFPAYVRNHRHYRVTISGGTTNGKPFLGKLSADVVLTDPAHQIVVVNPVTTLVSRVLDERPGLPLDRAQELIRHFLGLPAHYGLGLTLRQGPHYASPFFSPALFLTEAEAAGGLRAFEQQLLDELRASPSAQHWFRSPNALKSQSPVEDPVEELIDDIAGQLVMNALSYFEDQGLGWVMGQSGQPTSGATAAGIAALQAALLDLQGAIETLTIAVAQLTTLVQSTATKTQYEIITETAQTLGTQVCDEQSRLTYFAQECPPLPDGATRKPPKHFCVEESALIVFALSSDPIFSSYSNLEGYVQDNGTLGLEGMLHLYSLWLGQSKQFFRAADSTKMQNLYNYWNGVLLSSSILKVELLHQEGEQEVGGLQLIAFLGNPTLTPPTTGILQANNATNLSLMFPPVPTDPVLAQNGGVVINTKDHTMWALAPWMAGPGQPPPPAGGWVNATVAPACTVWNGITGPDLSTQTGQTGYPNPYLGFASLAYYTQGVGCSYNPSNGIVDTTGCWLSAPTKAQWQAAAAFAPTSGSLNWHDWLIQQTQTTADEMPQSNGFYNWTGNCPGKGSPVMGAAGTSDYWYLNPASPTSSGSSFQNVNGSVGVFAFGIRTLAPGEQYFWYQ